MNAERLPTKETGWPSLPLESWRDTKETLHMWMQIVGKVTLALTPPMNHFWNVAMRVTARGLVTPSLIQGDRTFNMTFDFIDHRLLIQCSDGASEAIALKPRSVAEFYRLIKGRLRHLGIEARIWPMPVEIPDPIRFDMDTKHHAYDPKAANAFWRILVSITPVFERFRGRFIGKSSPVHFFWGSMDLASTRFSGRRAPARAGADKITQESYSHEVISHGFWPGGGPIDEPAFYAYAAPEPDGFKNAVARPQASFYSKDLSEFILPYAAVQSSALPETDLTAFLESTYNAGADSAKWDRANLEREG